jgi:hypothetical protein
MPSHKRNNNENMKKPHSDFFYSFRLYFVSGLLDSFCGVEELASARQDFEKKTSKKNVEEKKLNMINFIVRALQRETALFIPPVFFLLRCSFFYFIFGHKTAKQLFFPSSRSLLKTTLLMLQCDDERW